MILATYQKQPAEVKDYDIDYLPWLSPMGDTIDNISASVACMTDPADTAMAIDSVSNTVSLAKLWISGGTDKQKYKVTITVTTVGGRTDQSELIFKVKDI